MWRIRVACWISKATCMHTHVHAHAHGCPHKCSHIHTHTNMQYFLFFCSSCYVNTTHCYVIRTLPVFFNSQLGYCLQSNMTDVHFGCEAAFKFDVHFTIRHNRHVRGYLSQSQTWYCCQQFAIMH